MIVAAAVLLTLPFGAQTAASDDARAAITVLTSFPASFYEPVREAFESSHPHWRLRIVNTKTTAAITQLQERADEGVDVFWASAPDAFEVLKAALRLAPLTARPTGAPVTVGNQPINDPDGAYLGFALSGYGLLWNQRYLDQHGLPAPKRWEDLRSPVYARHLGITAPSRSGTMHLMVETVLQLQGWERGWATWMEIAGNLTTVTARSYGVVDGIVKGRFGIGLTIDFLGQTTGSEAQNLRFLYPADSLFLPASVAMLRDAPNPTGAEAFIDFLLSRTGQDLLVRPDIQRLPVHPDAYERAPAGYPDPYRTDTGDDRFLFDRVLSSARYELVNLLFDELITFRVKTLNRVWQLIHEGEARLAIHHDPVASDLLRAARAAATSVPVTAAQAADPAYSMALRRSVRGLPVSTRQAELEAAWRAFSQRNLDEALAVAERAVIILRVAGGEGVWP